METVTVSKAYLEALEAEHKAAKRFCNIYFNPSVPTEDKYDAAARVSHHVVFVDRESTTNE